MKNIPEYVRYVLSGAVSALVASSAWAGVPLNNLQGTGGIAFNPLAYTAGVPALASGGVYAYTGDKDKFYRDGNTKDLGVGGGFVLSAQYQF